MKKLNFLLLVLMLAAMPMGCGDDDGGGGSDGDTDSDTDTDTDTDGDTDTDADTDTDTDTDTDADTDGDTDTDTDADTDADSDSDSDTDAACVTELGGTCTADPWTVCPVGYQPYGDMSEPMGCDWTCCEPVDPGYSCIDTNTWGTCIMGVACEGCWGTSEGPSECPEGRVCCDYICD